MTLLRNDVITKGLLLSSGSFRSGLFCYGSYFLFNGFFAGTAGSFLSSFLGLLEHVLIVVNELDDTHLSSIAQTEACAEDTGVTTGTVSDLLAYILEEFGNDLFLLEEGSSARSSSPNLGSH